jgi:hypothetical protein
VKREVDILRTDACCISAQPTRYREVVLTSSGKLVLIFSMLIGSSFLVMAQTANPITGPKTSPHIPLTRIVPAAPAPNVDETFDLNIDERHYSQDDFAAATAVGVDEGNLKVQVGVALASGRIDVLLRNVHGQVRFRGSLDRILEVINNRPGAAPVSSGSRSMPAPD